MKCPRCGSPPPATLMDWVLMLATFGTAYGLCWVCARVVEVAR